MSKRPDRTRRRRLLNQLVRLKDTSRPLVDHLVEEHVDAILRAQQLASDSTPSTLSRSGRRAKRRWRLLLAATVAVSLLIGIPSLAAAGALPGPLQDAASAFAETLGIDIPRSGDAQSVSTDKKAQSAGPRDFSTLATVLLADSGDQTSRLHRKQGLPETSGPTNKPANVAAHPASDPETTPDETKPMGVTPTTAAGDSVGQSAAASAPTSTPHVGGNGNNGSSNNGGNGKASNSNAGGSKPNGGNAGGPSNANPGNNGNSGSGNAGNSGNKPNGGNAGGPSNANPGNNGNSGGGNAGAGKPGEGNAGKSGSKPDGGNGDSNAGGNVHNNGNAGGNKPTAKGAS
jgi:hypothetical protein